MNPPNASITNELAPLAGGGFLVTMMGGPQGMAPGRVVEFNPKLELVAEYPSDLPQDGFNPHGISIRPKLNLMVTSDFICPVSTLDIVPATRTCGGVSESGISADERFSKPSPSHMLGA